MATGRIGSSFARSFKCARLQSYDLTSRRTCAFAMNSIRFGTMLFSMLVVATASHAADVVVPNANLNAENIPPIPAALAS